MDPGAERHEGVLGRARYIICVPLGSFVADTPWPFIEATAKVSRPSFLLVTAGGVTVSAPLTGPDERWMAENRRPRVPGRRRVLLHQGQAEGYHYPRRGERRECTTGSGILRPVVLTSTHPRIGLRNGGERPLHGTRRL